MKDKPKRWVNRGDNPKKGYSTSFKNKHPDTYLTSVSDDVIVSDVGDLEIVTIICMYTYNVSNSYAVADLKVKKSGQDDAFRVEVSFKEGRLIHEDTGGEITPAEWFEIKEPLAKRYARFLSNKKRRENMNNRENLLDGQNLVDAVNYGIMKKEVEKVYPSLSLKDGDLVAEVGIYLDDQRLKGKLTYHNGTLEAIYKGNKNEPVEIPDHVTEDLTKEVRKIFIRETNALKKEKMSIGENIPGRFGKAVRKKKQKQGEEQKEEQEEKRPTHGLTDYAIEPKLEDLNGLTNGTIVAEAKVATKNKKATFVAVYYDGALKFFEKGGDRRIKLKATRKFLTDEIRRHYVRA